MGEVIQKLPIGRHIQLLKYMNDLLPMAKQLQTFDNRHDGWCFECGQLWEDMNHVIWCPSDEHEKTRKDAFQVLHAHFQRQHTPTILTKLICDTMTHRIQWWCIPPPQWPTPAEPIMIAITTAFQSQTNIRWDHFFCGQLSTAWLTVIELYYWECQPGHIFTPDHWMCTTINAIGNFSLTLWHQRCESYHGLNGTQTLEWKCKNTALQAQEVFKKLSATHPMTNLLLHWQSLNTMMQWTQQHLDAYLATAEVLCEWNVEPGWTLMAILIFPMLHLCMGCGVGVISYDKISLVINEWL